MDGKLLILHALNKWDPIEFKNIDGNLYYSLREVEALVTWQGLQQESNRVRITTEKKSKLDVQVDLQSVQLLHYLQSLGWIRREIDVQENWNARGRIALRFEDDVRDYKNWKYDGTLLLSAPLARLQNGGRSLQFLSDVQIKMNERVWDIEQFSMNSARSFILI